MIKFEDNFDGSGSGRGNGWGDGCGSGWGDGCGNGRGYGSGYGSGDGWGYGWGDVFIAEDFENNYKGLIANGHRPLGAKPKEGALRHAITYFQNNQDLLDRVLETEIDVSVEKDDYIINGKVDLLLGKDDKLELLDFKSQQKPKPNDPILKKYQYQLHVYAHILKERYNKDPERLYLYWTAEDKRKDALMEIEYDEQLVRAAGKHFDSVATCIINKDFEIKNMPDKTKVCKECDFKHYCRVETN